MAGQVQTKGVCKGKKAPIAYHNLNDDDDPLKIGVAKYKVR